MASPTAGDAPLAAPAPAADATDTALAAAAAVPDPDAEFGFQRPELGKEKLVGTVGLHERHVFLCYKGPDLWPSHLEAAESDRLPRLLAAAIKARKPNLKKTIILTICEGEDGTESSNGDVLIFPDMIRYKGLTHFEVDNFVEEVLVKDIDWLPGSPEPMSGSYVFVCSHGSRDKRCGVCGPALIKRFKEEINGLGLDGQVFVSACSHVRGHKYAGNVIIFRSHANGEVTGHWYGYVVPDDVPVLLHKHIEQGENVDHLWRGQMGLSEEQQKQAHELRSMINGGKEFEETGTDGASCNPAAAGGCCQGNGGFNCCQTDLPKEKQDKSIAAEQNPKSSGKENDKEGGAGSKKGNTKTCPMPTWFETWERADWCPAPRTKRSKLPPSPLRDMVRRLMPTPHRPNLHQGRKGSPCLSYRDWSPALRENERSRPHWAEKDISGKEMRPLSHKERERSPLKENYMSPIRISNQSSRPVWGREMRHQAEMDIRGKGMRPQSERDWNERGLRRTQGERQVAQFRDRGCYTPWSFGRERMVDRERSVVNERNLGKNIHHWETRDRNPDRERDWNERGLRRSQGERKVAQFRDRSCYTPWSYGRERMVDPERSVVNERNLGKNIHHWETRDRNPELEDAKDWRRQRSDAGCKTPYWHDLKPAGGSQRSFRHDQAPRVITKESRRETYPMLYASKIVHSSPQQNDDEYDDSFDIESPYYNPYSD